MSFGGIAGLFLGFSILSGVEIIYFFTLRAVCMVYKDEKLLLDIDRKKKAKPMEEFYLGFKLKRPNQKKTVHFTIPGDKVAKNPSKLLIFDGQPRKNIPDFVPRGKPAPVSYL